MTRPAVEVADVLAAQGDAFLAQHPWLSVQQRTVLRAMTRCRTAALGGHRDRCDTCGPRGFSYNSCLMESKRFWGVRVSSRMHTPAVWPIRQALHSP
jgi:hypothetical protein